MFAMSIAMTGLLAIVSHAEEGRLPEGKDIAQQVDDRSEGTSVSRYIQFTLTDKRGKKREQMTRAYRKDYGDVRRSVVFYTNPKNVEGTAFLTFDYTDSSQEDDQWLYLSAMRKVRRISSANRGDYFLGTDFTYYDMKHESDVEVEIYLWETLRREDVAGRTCFVIEATPRDTNVIEELGYSRVQFWIDVENWMKRKAEFWDSSENPLKTISFNDIRQVEGLWTAHELVAKNHKTGHTTVLRMTDVDYNGDLDDDKFTTVGLKRGP
jgi:hypothetical protein